MTTPSVRAAVIPAPNTPVELREYPWPELAPGAAMLRTRYSEVCGTDVHLFHGKLAGVPYPLIPGHVSVGHLAAIRGTITDIDGDRSVKATSSRSSTCTRRVGAATNVSSPGRRRAVLAAACTGSPTAQRTARLVDGRITSG